jgi:hypothetical protein
MCDKRGRLKIHTAGERHLKALEIRPYFICRKVANEIGHKL